MADRSHSRRAAPVATSTSSLGNHPLITRTQPSDANDPPLSLFALTTPIDADIHASAQRELGAGPTSTAQSPSSIIHAHTTTQVLPMGVHDDLDASLLSHEDTEQFLERQKKMNHKEVERRRRVNINKGMEALVAALPETGEKAKSKILQRAANHIADLKQAQAALVEKTTLERLMLEQTINELTVQLDSARMELEDLRSKYEQVTDENMLYKQEVARIQGELNNGQADFANLGGHDGYLEESVGASVAGESSRKRRRDT
ncbi:basic helix-loop-helix protein [Gonapodya sp. JEL0774]|nr:basic helix-loop-helix protein [Gonapodya sp. JEL0774]